MNEWIFFAHKGVNPPTTICIHPLKTQNNVYLYIVFSVFWFIFLPCTCHRRLIRWGPELRDYLPPLSLHRWSVYDFWIKEELPGCVMDGQSTGAMADNIMWCIIGYQPGEKMDTSLSEVPEAWVCMTELTKGSFKYDTRSNGIKLYYDEQNTRQYYLLTLHHKLFLN